MALADLQTFIIQCLNQYDSSIDTSAGSPADVNVIQPILQRLGTDPYTVDIGLFIQTTLNQQFPDLPTKEGDAITDLLIKAAIVLWNPIVRETTRISYMQSVKNAGILTAEEADALGANYFAIRPQGQKSTVTARIYFAQPQNISVTPSNFITTKSGLHFFPIQTQSIATSEMLLNLEGSLYYFDVSCIAEAAGDQYNIGPDELATIANISAAVRITNKLQAQNGLATETPADFINGVGQDLTERSLTTLAGITAKIDNDFAGVTNLNVVGMGDAAMQRDIITGGGLGSLLAQGLLMETIPDGANGTLTRRVRLTGVDAVDYDFTNLLGPTQSLVSNFVITLVGCFPSSSIQIRDIEVQDVVDESTIDLAEEVLLVGETGIPWMLRQTSLTLSGIPGGILYPNTAQGTLSMPTNEVHIGGATDVYVRGNSFDAGTLTIESIVDDEPIMEGEDAFFQTWVGNSVIGLGDLKLGDNYSLDSSDPNYVILESAVANQLSIEILDPPNAGTYRIISVFQPLAPGLSPEVIIVPDYPTYSSTLTSKWRISSSLFIDLVTPKDTKVTASDLTTIQGSVIVSTVSGTDFSNYGVAINDVLRITSGNLIVGEYTIEAITSSFNDELEVDRQLAATISGAKYSIYTPNPSGGVKLPFVRVQSIELLDTSGQAVGTTIPYAIPIDVEILGMANSAHGIKIDVTDARLGIVTQPVTSPSSINGQSLTIGWTYHSGTPATVVVPFLGVTTVQNIVDQINEYTLEQTGGSQARALDTTIDLSTISLVDLNDNFLSLSFNHGPPIDIFFSGLTSWTQIVGQINAVISTWATASTYTSGGTIPNCLMITSLAYGLNQNISVGNGGAVSVLGLTPGTTYGSNGLISNLAVVMEDGESIGILPVGTNTRIVSQYSTTGALAALFPSYSTWQNSEGDWIDVTSRDISSVTAASQGGWISLRPILDPIFDVAQTLDGLQIGFYDGITMMNSPVFNEHLYDALLIGDYDFNPEIDVHLQVGSRSLGTARCYFMDPTSFEVGQSAIFTHTATNGAMLNYFPDPMNNYTFIPQPPNGSRPLDGVTDPWSGFSNSFHSDSIDFVLAGVLPGDYLILDYLPLLGGTITAPAGYVSNLSGKTFEVSLSGGPTQTITFVQDTPNVPNNAVSLQGIVSEINSAVGSAIVSMNSTPALVFNPTTSLVIFPEGTANALLGFTSSDAVSNASPNAGTYIIELVAIYTPSPDTHTLAVTSDIPTSNGGHPYVLDGQQFSIVRPATQRCCSTLMSTQTETASLYYFDVVLLSQGTGDQYNLAYMSPLSVTGFRSDGYWLTTADPNLSFSPLEQPELHLSPTILEVGVNDSLLNATQLTGQNIQLNYEYSSLADNVDTYIRSDVQRVVCESTLGRHLIPYFVRFSLNYSGGSAVSLVTSDIEKYILELDPDEALTVSAIERLVSNRNASSVSNPLSLIALIHNPDRSITVERSQDYLNTGVLAAFFPDVLDITQSLST